LDAVLISKFDDPDALEVVEDRSEPLDIKPTKTKQL